ncbi:MAG TPA: SGNH hydrolase domain-containing protein [Sporichthyaceae bacterium]
MKAAPVRSARARGSVLAAMLLAVALLPGWAMAHRDNSACAGAAALPNHCRVPNSGSYVPDAAHAEADHAGNGQADGCWTTGDFTQFRSCTLGRPQAKYTVALVGNSHAGQYLNPLRTWADQYDMRIVAYLIPKCFAIDEKIDIGDKHYGPVMNDRCRAWGQWVQRQTNALKPDLIVTTERTYKKPIPVRSGGQWQTWKAGYQRYLKGWTSQGQHLLVVRDNPVPGKSVPACLAAHPHKFSKCAGDRAKWLPPDALVAAAESLHTSLISAVDLSDYMCTDTTCPGVLGGLCVYRDHSHMTATWVRSLQAYLEEPFAAALHHHP